MYWLWYILIGLVAGWLANVIMKGSGAGLILNIVIGIIGGILGGWIFGLFGFAATGTIGSLITALVGAIVLLWIISLFNRRSPKK